MEGSTPNQAVTLLRVRFREPDEMSTSGGWARHNRTTVTITERDAREVLAGLRYVRDCLSAFRNFGSSSQSGATIGVLTECSRSCPGELRLGSKTRRARLGLSNNAAGACSTESRVRRVAAACYADRILTNFGVDASANLRLQLAECARPWGQLRPTRQATFRNFAKRLSRRCP